MSCCKCDIIIVTQVRGTVDDDNANYLIYSDDMQVGSHKIGSL